ncbi:MAG: bifunctional alpha,alpha-trehalose-phosphate synthase (UDP-forming)/trehalose-phosphatase [Chloroflexota bacterium]
MRGQEASEQRVIIVSNRLPFTVSVNDGALDFAQSGGGLVSGLTAWLATLTPGSAYSYTWVGWPGISIPDELHGELESVAGQRFNAHPVYLSDQEMESFYQGFCNRTIWPLFHYFQAYVAYDEASWTVYKRVNEQFCAAVMEIVQPGDIIWVHDYHLMLLPGLLRERLPDTPIGFFLHIPFPTYELFRMMPRAWGEKILNGLLGANVVGFHARDYTDHFLNSVGRILGYKRAGGEITAGDRTVNAGTYPMGIDYEKYAKSAGSEEVQQAKSELKRTLLGSKVILSIDRLDYTKGIVNRLLGYELFLQQNPEWREKVVLALLVTPSRVGVQHYSETKYQIEALVGQINGEFGNIGWVPIRYQYAFIPLVPLVTLYNTGDIALVTPLRDGMNLISKEYLACRTDSTGVLILSIFAGAATELTEAVLVNPNSKEEIAEALRAALEMPVAEQIRRNKAMQNRLIEYDVSPWAQRFIKDLLRATRSKHDRLAMEEARRRTRPSSRQRFIYKNGEFVQLPERHPKPDDR